MQQDLVHSGFHLSNRPSGRGLASLQHIRCLRCCMPVLPAPAVANCMVPTLRPPAPVHSTANQSACIACRHTQDALIHVTQFENEQGYCKAKGAACLPSMGKDDPSQGDVDASGHSFRRRGPQDGLHDAGSRANPHLNEELVPKASPKTQLRDWSVGACRRTSLLLR